jgi:hypothetical protein
MADPLAVDAFFADLDGLVAAGREPDRLGSAVRDGTAAPPIARRAALEAYHFAKWTTPECALLIANAPDVYAFTMDHAAHYGHWSRELARRTGYLDDGGGARVTRALCHALDLDDAAIQRHEPLPETIAAAFTMLYYVRRSYEAGLAVRAFAWERSAAGRAHEEAVAGGLRAHYAARTDAPAPVGGAPKALELFRTLTLGRDAQARCREAIRNTLLVFGTRVHALNGWIAA